ncbi:MAG: redox-sensing transcriptional repressor Rex [Bacteroidales bacterium]|nr:redox-sensing transcriptional repressor Rex [Bacteroidales bacterium]
MEEVGLKNIPEKTVERLLQYLRLLRRYKYLDQPYIFSHDLARALKINSVHVRRDLMLVGIQGNNRTGYDVKKLIEDLEQLLFQTERANAILVGIENLGTATTEYFLSEDSNIRILASFDFYPNRTKSSFPELLSLGIQEMPDFIAKNKIVVAVVAVIDDDMESIISLLINSGIKSIINLSTTKIEVPDNIYLQEFDIITGIEKSVFFGGF